jgi:aldehyde:ferredoxin oxidoreductase
MASRYDGYMGKILDIDLSTGAVGEYSVSDGTGSGFSAADFSPPKSCGIELAPGIDPLSPMKTS